MELELQEWLFLILGLVIVVVLAHGFWVQYFGSDRLPLKLDKRFASAAPESGGGKDVIDLKRGRTAQWRRPNCEGGQLINPRVGSRSDAIKPGCDTTVWDGPGVGSK